MKTRSPGPSRLSALIRAACALGLLAASLAHAPAMRQAGPCPKLDKSDPGCIAPNPEERAKVGSACRVHPKSRLRLDVVPLHFGITSFQPGGGDEAKQFPNARVVYSRGCVVGVERWTEVAYCRECRRAFYWHNPRYLLHPIQPLAVERRENR